MIAHMSYAVVHGTDSSPGSDGIGLLTTIGLGVIGFVLVGMIVRILTSRPPALWGSMPGSSSDNSSDLGFLLFVSLVIAILLVIGLRGST